MLSGRGDGHKPRLLSCRHGAYRRIIATPRTRSSAQSPPESQRGCASDRRGMHGASSWCEPPGRVILGVGGYRPVANTVWTWHRFSQEQQAYFLFFFALARRTGAAHVLWPAGGVVIVEPGLAVRTDSSLPGDSGAMHASAGRRPGDLDLQTVGCRWRVRRSRAHGAGAVGARYACLRSRPVRTVRSRRDAARNPTRRRKLVAVSGLEGTARMGRLRGGQRGSAARATATRLRLGGAHHGVLHRGVGAVARSSQGATAFPSSARRPVRSTPNTSTGRVSASG